MADIGKVKDFVKKFIGAGDPVCDGNLVMKLDLGEGIRMGDWSSSEFGWRDMEGAIDVKGVGLNDPSWAQIGTTDFFAYNFAVNDEAWFNYHLPHDMVPGSDFHIHAHWITDSTVTDVVKWQWQLAYASGYNTATYPLGTPAVVTAEEAAPGVAYRHMITESAAVSLPTSEVDGILMSHVKRVTNGASDPGGIFLLTCDIHYQSTGLPTKNRNPDFYT